MANLFSFGVDFGSRLNSSSADIIEITNNSITNRYSSSSSNVGNLNRNEIIDSDDENEEDERNDEDIDDDSYLEFRAKIPRLDNNSDVKESFKNENSNEYNNGGINDEETCSICLEPWTNSGVHRLVCLKCGHLFGEGCIDRWLKSAPKCPQCNRPSKRSEIRRIFAKSIKVLDTTDLDKALKDLENEKQIRKKAEIEASEIKLRFQLVRDELSLLQQKYNTLLDKYKNYSADINTNVAYIPKSVLNSDSASLMNFSLEKMINLTEVSGGCRVLSFSLKNLAILASQPSNTTMFPGFGIKKINFLDYKLSQYVPIHNKLIRDMALNSHYDDESLLTCSLDKTIKLTNISSNRLIHSFECQHPIWSCCYNLENPFYFYAGLANGHVLMFDKRKIDQHVQILNSDQNTFSPVCNLNYITRDDKFRKPGLLIGQLDKVSFYESVNAEEYRYNSLLLESNIMSCSIDQMTKHVLVSTRPTQKHTSVRHMVYELTSSNSDNSDLSYSLNLIQTYNGSNIQKMLARSKLFCLNSQLYACVPCESTKSAVIWNVSTGETCNKLPNQNDILDICPFQYKDQCYISTLTDKQLRIFKKS